MARYTGPKCRYCRAERTKLFLKGDRCLSSKCPMNDIKTTGTPGKDPRARSKKPTNYGLQLREKQKLKRTYCMLEKQFKLFFNEAARIPGKTGENLIMLLEQRLDNVVFRLHFASSRNQAAQLVNHGHILVNGKRVDIPSYRLRPGDEVEVAPRAKKNPVIRANVEERRRGKLSPWLEFDPETLKGRFLHRPAREDIVVPVNELQVIEYYSR